MKDEIKNFKSKVRIDRKFCLFVFLLSFLTVSSFCQYINDRDRKIKLQNIYNEALKYVRKGEIEKSIETLKEGLKIWNESPEINYNIGLLYFDLENYKEAEKYAIRATKYGFRMERSGTGLRSTREKYEMGFPIEKWNFELAMAMGNNFLRAYDLLGNIYFRTLDFEKAIKAFEKVVEIDRWDALGYYNLGCAYFAKKNYEKAEDSWKKAIKYDHRGHEMSEEPEEIVYGDTRRISVTTLKRTVSFHSYKSLGFLYKERGEIEKGIESFLSAVKLFPTDGECYYEVGMLYIILGKKTNAIEFLEKYLEYGVEKEKEVREIIERLKKQSASEERKSGSS